MSMNVRDNLDAGRYDNKVPYNIAMAPIDLKMTASQAKAHMKSERQRKLDQRVAYREEENRIAILFRSDLETEHGVAGHPKSDKLWSLAWEHGHSFGYSEVIHYYEEFVELLK